MAIDIEKSFTFRNGLEFGDGGPKQFADAGSPIGVYNPPAGSLYIDTETLFIYKKIGGSSSDWVPFPNVENNRVIFTEDDFISADLSGMLGWVTSTAGGGSVVQKSTTGLNSTDRARGCNSIIGGNANNRYAASTLDINGVCFGYTRLVQKWRLYLIALSTSVQRYECTFGYIDNLSTTQNHTDGIYFLYDDSVSANWQCVTSNAGTRTTTNSGVAASIGAFVNFEIRVTNSSQVLFYINGNLVATNTTNIPTGANISGSGIKMLSRVGNGFKECVLDYYSELSIWDSAR